MKKAALITLLLGMVVSSSAFAGGMTLGFSGGMAMPTGDFGDAYDTGFKGGVFGEYGLNEQFALGLGVDYAQVGASDQVIAAAEAYARALIYYQTGEFLDVTAEIKSSIIPVTVYAKWMPPTGGNVAPYIQAGAGYYLMRTKVTLSALGESGSDSATENKPGFFGGLGVDFKTSPQVKLGLFARAHDILTEGQSSMYFNVGASLGFGLAGN